MPPKRKAAAKKKGAQSKYMVNIKIQIPNAVVEAAQQLPEAQCNKTIQEYIKTTHNIDVKKLSFAAAPKAEEKAPVPSKADPEDSYY